MHFRLLDNLGSNRFAAMDRSGCTPKARCVGVHPCECACPCDWATASCRVLALQGGAGRWKVNELTSLFLFLPYTWELLELVLRRSRFLFRYAVWMATLCLSWTLSRSMPRFPARLSQSPLEMGSSSSTAISLQSSSTTRRACTLCLNSSKFTATRGR